MRHDFHPDMSPAEAAKMWLRKTELSSDGELAIYTDGDAMSVNYMETPHGITIICKNGTGIPVPYRYSGEHVGLI